jgi:hypothetical protein
LKIGPPLFVGILLWGWVFVGIKSKKKSAKVFKKGRYYLDTLECSTLRNNQHIKVVLSHLKILGIKSPVMPYKKTSKKMRIITYLGLGFSKTPQKLHSTQNVGYFPNSLQYIAVRHGFI